MKIITTCCLWAYLGNIESRRCLCGVNIRRLVIITIIIIIPILKLIRRPLLARGTTAAKNSPFLCPAILEQWDQLSNSPGAIGSSVQQSWSSGILGLFACSPLLVPPPGAQTASKCRCRVSSLSPKGCYSVPRGTRERSKRFQERFLQRQVASKSVPRGFQEPLGRHNAL